ncbi:MAG: hypothetical protein WC484_00005 [Candidatus Omnitrophota bacterium]
MRPKIKIIVSVCTFLILIFFLVSFGSYLHQKIRIKNHATGATTSIFTVQINLSPLFESPQGWGPGFALAKGDGPGVVVGPGTENPNVFAQSFLAKPYQPFKVIARALSVVAPKARGRFQINWTDSQDKFISVSIESFEVTDQEKKFEFYVHAPKGAVAGTLYVVGDGSKDVVRYTEMRLLGKM